MTDISLINIWMSDEKLVPVSGLGLAAYLLSKGHDVEFLDFDQKTDESKYTDTSTLVSFISKAKSDIIGISLMSNSLPYLILALRRFRIENPGKTIILGGPGPSSVARQLLEKYHFIDYIVVGEGEQTLDELLIALKKGSGVKDVEGIVFRSGRDGDERVISTPRRQRIKDIDSLPLPAYELINMKRYDKASVISSRGCPFDCSYCYTQFHWGRCVSFKSLDTLFKELDSLLGRFSHINFSDDLFLANRKRALLFCDRYRKEGYSFTWNFSTRIDVVDDEVLDDVKKSNATSVFFGLESGSANVLRKVNKGYTYRAVKNTMKKMSERFDNVTASIMYGFPFETWKDFTQTIRAAQYCFDNNIIPALSLISPQQETRIYRDYGHSIHFSGHISDFISVAGTDAKSMKKPLLDLILSEKDIFAPFYNYETPRFSQKLRAAGKVISVAREMNQRRHETQQSYH